MAIAGWHFLTVGVLQVDNFESCYHSMLNQLTFKFCDQFRLTLFDPFNLWPFQAHIFKPLESWDPVHSFQSSESKDWKRNTF